MNKNPVASIGKNDNKFNHEFHDDEQYQQRKQNDIVLEDPKKATAEEPPVPRKTNCCCCLTYDRGSLVIACIDACSFVVVLAMIIKLRVVTSDA